jgi:acyl-CoA synthetase (AMP-forming)/AMP-acid ligase II
MESPFRAFEAQALATPNAPLLIAPASLLLSYAPDGFRYSYGEVLASTLELARRFADAGYGSGQRVALLLENRPEFFTHWLALNSLGVSIVPLNPDLRLEELIYQINVADADLIVAYSRESPTLAGFADPKVPISEAGASIPESTKRASRREPQAEDECALLFTSGSTGKPKGCILSNRYFLILANWYVTQGGIAQVEPNREVALTPLPMFHMNALGCTALGMMLVGGAIVPLDRFHASRWWRSVSESGATIVHCLGVIPAILLRLPETPYDRAHRVKFAFGPGVDADHKIEFERRFGIPIVEAWAMTETGGRAATTTARDDYTPGLRCVGRPTEGMEYRIVDDAEAPVARGTPGELLVRAAGDNPRDGFFSGYLKDEAATEAAWAGGWFHTGDVVYEDEAGLLYFFDRKKSIVRRSGENIAVLEVEAALGVHPAIKAVAVTPVADDLRGEEVFAFLVRADEADGAEPASLAEAILRDAAERLAYHKLPAHIAFIEALPLSSTQKLQRGEIKAMAADWLQRGEAIDLRDWKASARRKTAPSS